MSLELAPEVEKIVRERAAAEGLSVNDLLVRTFGADKGWNDAEMRVRALLAQWQTRDTLHVHPPLQAPAEVADGDTLFRRWRELDAVMTEEEREAEDRLWQDIQRGIDDTRVLLGMQPLLR